LQTSVWWGAPAGPLESDPADIFFNRGNIDVDDSQLEAAVKEFDESVKLKPDFA
jgi:hypothetical protein